MKSYFCVKQNRLLIIILHLHQFAVFVDWAAPGWAEMCQGVLQWTCTLLDLSVTLTALVKYWLVCYRIAGAGVES